MNKTLFTKIFSASLIVMLALAAFPVTPAYAASLTVTTNADVVAANGQCSLREAITNANNDANTNADCTGAGGYGDDTITFSAAVTTITLTSALPNIADGGGANNLTIDGGSDVTINANAVARIFNVTAGTFTVQNITLSNGQVDGNGGAILYAGGEGLSVSSTTFNTNRTVTGGGNDGGAIYHTAGTLSILNSSFTGNYTQDNGGAVYIANGTGTMTIDGSTFTSNNNVAIDDGGAIYLNNGTLSIGSTSANTFSGNVASGDGGAIFVNGGTLTVNNTSFTNSTAANSADNGGAIFHDAATLLTVTNSTFTGNTATAGDGGAIVTNDNGSSLTISGSTFTSNTSTDDGGAIANVAVPTTITSSTFASNSITSSAGNAALGGAIRNEGAADATVIRLSTFTNNTITHSANENVQGGAIANEGSGFILANVTISGNSVTETNAGGGGNAQGGGLWSNDNSTIHNVTFSGNSATEAGSGAADGGNLHRNGRVVTVRNTILVSGTENGGAGNCGGTLGGAALNASFADNVSTVDCGAAVTTGSPNLGALTGSPQYFPLNTGSPAITTGNTTVCQQATSTNDTSQNGQERITATDLTCDIGSYETPANTAPTVQAAITDVTVNEDAVNTVFSLYPNFQDTESADNLLTYTVTAISNTALFTAPAGALPIAIADPTNFTLDYTANANGVSNITIRATDPGSLFVEDTFQVTVNAVNDEPSFTASNPPAVNEDAGAQTVSGWATVASFGAPNESGQAVLAYNISGSTCGTLLSAGPAVSTAGVLTYTPAANANGTCNFNVAVQDNGGIANGGDDTSPTQNFTITVNAVNDEPSFTASNPAAVSEDAGAQTVNAWATFNPGNASEAGQTATYTVSNLGAGCAALLTGSPTVNASGDLSYTPATNQNGTCTFDVSVQDSGGTANGGDDTSGTQNFTITVNAVNDEPSESVAPNQFRIDAITVIPQGGLTNETSVVFKATATDPEAQQYQLEVEVVSDINPFTGTPTCTSPLTNSGTEASTGSCGPFAAGSYIWRYRFVDSGSAASAWTVFGASDPDFIIDNGSPTVTNVTSTDADGNYFAGNTITIQITFSESVTVTGTPQLLLELGAVDGLANYVSGSGSNILTFTYTIVVGDNTPDLDYVAANSLTLNGGSIQDAALNNASLTLPNPGAANSLGGNKNIVIDALILVVVNNGVGSVPDTGDGSLSENEQVASSLNITQLAVRFNKDVRNVPSSTTDPDEVDNPANYILVRSNTAPVGNFNTISCAGGVVAPDIQTLVTSVTYSNGGGSGPFEATLTLAAPLATDGFYRLYVCGTTSIVQANNPALALAGNNTTNGTDFIRNFQITTAPIGGGGNDDDGPRLNVAALPATGFAPNRVTILPEQPAERAYAELGDLWIEIPALGIKTSIVGVPQTAEGEWDVTWLANNVGWLNGTAFPSWEGNSVVTAHVTNADGLNGPFANLKKLKYGDQIIVHAYGDKYIFEVRASRLARPFSTSYAFEDLENHSYMTLITCQTYLPKTDTYLFRRIVRAVLVSVESE